MPEEKGLLKGRLHARRLDVFEARRERKGEAWAESYRLTDSQARKDAASGRKQREAGAQSSGRTHRVMPSELRAAVIAKRRANSRLTYTDACRQVADHFKYKSTWSVRQATTDLKWESSERRGR
jgi:hypothetical protein